MSSQLKSHFKIIDIYPDTIFLFTSKKQTKKIPIKHNININFAESFWQKKNIKINPDSILIKGNKKELDQIKFLETENLTLFNLTEGKSGFVFLKKNPFLELKTQVKYSFETEKYTEKNIEVLIEILNPPENKKIVLFPKKISINYLVSEHDFENINNEDFRVVCNFENIDISTKNCELILMEKPENIKINHMKKEVEFLIQG